MHLIQAFIVERPIECENSSWYGYNPLCCETECNTNCFQLICWWMTKTVFFPSILIYPQNMQIMLNWVALGRLSGYNPWSIASLQATSKNMFDFRTLCCEFWPQFSTWKCINIKDSKVSKLIMAFKVQGGFFHWYPPKMLKYEKPRLGESTLT